MNVEGPRNLWLPSTEAAVPALAAPGRRDTPVSTVRPQGGLYGDEGTAGLPMRAVDADEPPPPWWWLGCHGGAGVSSLATAVPGGGDCGRAWPIPAGRVVLVARTHAHGLAAAQVAARQWAAGRVPGVELLGLAAVADAPGRLPHQLAETLRLVAGGVPEAWFVPWIDAFRMGTSLTGGLPRALAAMERRLGPLRINPA